MPDQYSLPDFFRGDPPDHNRFNEMLAALRDLLHRVGIDTVRGPTSPQDFRGLEVADHFLGVTTETPPTGQSALTDAQYYVKRGLAEYKDTVTAASSGSSTPKFNYDRITVPIAEPVKEWQETVVATNLSELPANPSLTNRGTHAIPTGTPVHVFVSLSRTSPAFKVYWFVFGGSLPRAQYVGMVLQQAAQNAAATMKMFTAHVPFTS